MQEPIRYTEFLLLDGDLFSHYSFQGPDESNVSEKTNAKNLISKISLVNIFIGTNNSGKSRLLRNLFSLKGDETLYNTNRYSAQDYFNLVESLEKETKSNTDKLQISKMLFSFSDILRHKNNFLSFLNMNYELLDKELRKIINCKEITREINKTRDDEDTLLRLASLGQEYLEKIEKMSIILGLGNEKKYYIPTLRGMRPFDVQYNNFYQDRTYQDYFINTLSEKQQIFTGLELYQDLKEKLLGEPEDRDLVKSFEDFLSKKFFDSERVTLVPKEKGNEPKVVNVKIGNEDQRPIHQLGDGLQNLIICTFKIFTEQERCLFFIEEPDMFMHPSFQRAFLEVLCEHDRHQYFITSHSNHFLDMTLDFENISVFHFSKEKDVVEGKANFKVRTTSTRDHRLLFDLGVGNSSVFLSNSTIWVEGITDRLYLRAYMKKYISELKDDDHNKKIFSNFREDYHYSFVEYQGSNLTHWNFDDNEDLATIKANYVCANAFVIADGDVATKGNRTNDFKAMLQERFYLLSVKEIENLMPPEVLKEMVKEKFIKYGGNIAEIEYDSYAKEDVKIGEYLEGFLQKKPENKTIFSAESGTIKGKVDFCKKAIQIMENPYSNDSDFTWSLPPKLTELCQEIFEHIKKHNPS